MMFEVGAVLTKCCPLRLRMCCRRRCNACSSAVSDTLTTGKQRRDDGSETDTSPALVASPTLTGAQELHGLLPDGRGQLLGFFQILQDVNVGGQQSHVLLPAPIRHSQQAVQVLQGSAHNVPCTNKSEANRGCGPVGATRGFSLSLAYPELTPSREQTP